MEALAVANETRTAGMRWRRKVARQDGPQARLMLARVLERRRIPPEIGALRLLRFLTAATRIGTDKAVRVCMDAEVYRRDPRVRDLTLGERARLAAVLRHRAEMAKAWRGAR